MAVADNIIALKRKFGIDDDQLAEMAGVTREAVWHWLNKGVTPRKANVAKMCAALGVTADDVLSESMGLGAEPRGDRLRILGAVGVGTLPVRRLGRVHAGPAGDPDVFGEDGGTVEIPQFYLDIDPDCFVLDFEGDCMSRDFGDTTSLVVSPNSPFGNGSIVVAVIDGTDYVVRRMEQTARELRLKPNSYNPAYEPIVVPLDGDRSVKFEGKVLGCFRRFD